MACVLCLAALAACHGDASRVGDVRFARESGRFVIHAADTHALDSAGIRIAASATGDDVLGVPAALAPPGMHTQVMQFRFRSRGFFTAEPAAHFAVGLGGAWHKDDPATPQQDGLLVGRGIVIGNVREAANGCDTAPAIEIESFHRYGNRLLPTSCSVALEDGRWYRLTLAATRGGGIAYRLDDDHDRPVSTAAAADADADVPADLGGWWLLHVFANQHPEHDWSVDIAGLDVRWYPKPD